MKKRILVSLAALIFFAVLTLFAPTAGASPTVTVTTETYDIYGATAQELRDQMVLFGVTWKDGKKYDALTTWITRWHYTWESGIHHCEISGVETSVEVLFRLPKWVNKAESPPALRHRWERYMKALQMHENGHKDIGIAAAADIEAAIARMPAERTCEALELAANALGESILETYRALETDYDRHTGHGQTQGAVFP